eukprot:10204887-Karenia_brevis.AAC.1
MGQSDLFLDPFMAGRLCTADDDEDDDDNDCDSDDELVIARWYSLVMPPGRCKTWAIRGVTLLPRGPGGMTGFS